MGEAERYLWEGVPVGVPCFHIHHNRLLEWSTEPLEVRAEFIREEKPWGEVQKRLRLMRPVVGELPVKVVEAGRAVAEAGRAYRGAQHALNESGRTLAEGWSMYEKVGRAFTEACSTLDEAVERHRAEVETLHERECPGCPWDGETIFP